MASILIVEDEPVLARELGCFLEDAGHSVRLAGTAREATAALAEAEPDVALLDLRLPDASGIDVLAQLREQNPGVAVVLMTAFGSVSDAVQATRRKSASLLLLGPGFEPGGRGFERNRPRPVGVPLGSSASFPAHPRRPRPAC